MARELFAMGFGFVEVGTLTPRAQSGNEAPHLPLGRRPRHHQPARLQQRGTRGGASAPEVRRRRNCRRQYRPGSDSTDRIGDYVAGIARMAQVASYFTVNISSPNTPGLRDLQAPEALAALLSRVQDARAASPQTRSWSSSRPISPMRTCRRLCA